MQFPINTGPKEDHPNRVAALVGVDPKYYYKADELKLYENAINELYALLGAPNSSGNKVLDYTIEWVPGTYTFKITVRKYIFNGVLHTNTIYAERTLGASDLVYNRFDSFLIDANEQIIVWPGDAVEFPYPKEFDLDTYVLINFFRVDANTTAPTGISSQKVFDEGTNIAGGEWYTVYTSGELSLTQASVGTKSIKLVGFQETAHTAPATYEGKFLKEVLVDVFLTGGPKNRIGLKIGVTTPIPRILTLYVTHGQFNFNAYLIGTWQTLVIPGTSWTGNTNFSYNTIIPFNNYGNTTVYVDNIRLMLTDTEQESLSSHTHAQLSVLETITSTLISNWNTAYNWVLTNGANVLAHIANKQNSLATDGTGAKYPTVDAVNAGLATKLDASAYNQHFKGKYLTAAAMRAAHPTASVGDSAQVNEVGATTVVNYSWDDELVDWVITGSVSGGAANTDELPEGSSNLYFTTARVLATILTGISFATGTAVVATDTVLEAFGKLQKQISDLNESKSLKPIQVISQTLLVGSWALVGSYYEYDLADANISVDSIVDAIPDNDYVLIVKAAQILPKTVSSSGSVKLYSTNLPTGNIVVTINIFK